MREVKCRCYATEQELMGAFAALKKIYTGFVEMRKSTSPANYPFYLVVESTSQADQALQMLDRDHGGWGDCITTSDDDLAAKSTALQPPASTSAAKPASAGAPTEAQMAQELEKMEYEPLAPVELTLIRWSIGIGVGSLVFLYLLSRWLFPGGH